MAKTKAAAAPAVKAVGDIIVFTAFTAANPTVATADVGTDLAALQNGTTVTMTASAGDPDAMAAIDQKTATIADLDATAKTCTLQGIDLTDQDVTDLTGSAMVATEPPAPSPSPPTPDDVIDKANHQMSSMSPGVSAVFHPSPGVGGVPVEGWNPDVGDGQFETPAADRADTVPGGADIERGKPAPAPKPVQVEQPGDGVDPALQQGLAGDFDAIAQREGIK